MASSRVLPFVRGIDFSHNNFQEENFPQEIMKMTGLRWLKLNDANIDWIPEEFAALDKLEALSLTKNNLVTLHGELCSMPSLRSLVFRHNRINNNGLPSELFKLDDLSVLDLSHNQLKSVPHELEKCKGLLVLNLSHNDIISIPNQLFVSLTDLIHLDLSNNALGSLPPQMRRLINLQVLNLSNNPLAHNQLRLLQSLASLQSLNLSSTMRTPQNIPTSLDNLVYLSDLNLSCNNLSRIPDVIYTLKALKRINLSDNCITELTNKIDEFWPQLEVLNLSRNKLRALPQTLSKLEKLRRLYVNDNELDFEGIPNSIGKLYNLEMFMASNNNLELIPEGVVRCGKLKKLILSNNNLITLPDAIYLLNDLKVLDLNNNPNLVLPPKPTELQENKSIYNIDFTLANQLRKASTVNSNGFASASAIPKDPIARKMRLVRRAKEKTNESDSTKVLKAMTDLAKDHEKINIKLYEDEENLKPKRLLDSLEKPQLDYSDFFDEDVGQYIGMIIWEIDNFVPSRLDEALHGKFYEADCYIILRTFENENQNLDWEIFYLIGSQSTLDKKACSAIHAVNLRNYLSAHCRTIREEQGDESEAFLQIFPHGITYIEGGRTASGFYTVEEVAVSTRMYRLHELSCRQLYMQSVPLTVSALDSRFVFIVDTGYKIFVWNGKTSKNTVKQKARLLVEKINKEERKDHSELIFVNQSLEQPDFWQHFVSDVDPTSYSFRNDEIDSFKPFPPILYKVCLGTGYLELPQIHYKPKQLTKSHFETKCVYIMDVFTDVYIWIGQKSPRLLRAAALKLAQELFSMVNRPEFSMVTRCMEGIETQSFKSRFAAWEEITAVDFTRTAESVQKIGADLNKWVAEHSNLKYDLSALFMPRQPPITKQEAQQLVEEWNDDLESMEVFVLENKKFTKLPDAEFGHFFSGDCYVFLCRYWIPIEVDPQPTNEEEEEILDETISVVYFWQGREASNMGWLTFTFSLQKKFESLFGEKLEVIRLHQQQENLKFLSHFKQKFVIHQGKRDFNQNITERLSRPDEVELYQLRSNCDPITLRCVQINTKNVVLYSSYCYLLKIVPSADNEKGNVFLWVGSAFDPDYVPVAQEIAVMFSLECELSIVRQNEEPPLFCQFISPLMIETDCSFANSSRLFRCSNDKGYFTISEKCSDFCQDDLVDEDIMILDNGKQVFIWLGTHCSEVEVKLAHKSAQVYVQNMRIKQPDQPRTLMLTMKGKETRKFTKCFHAWSNFKQVKDPRINLDKQMLPIIYQHTSLYKKSQIKKEQEEDNN